MTEKFSLLIDRVVETLADEPQIKEYLAAKKAYTEDRALFNKVSEYNAQNMILEMETEKTEKDDLLISSVKARLDALYKEISDSETAKRLIESEESVNEFYNSLFAKLRFAVAPEDEGCGGNCASCGGCR